MNKLTFFDFKNNKSIIPLFLIFIFSFSLVFSRFIADLIAVLISIFVLFFFIKNKEFSFLRVRLYLWIFIFWLYLIINSLVSYVPFESLKTALPYIRFLFFIIFLNFFFKKKKYKFYFLVSFSLLYLGLFIDTLFEIYEHSSVTHYRPSSFFGSNLILGSFISKTFAIIIYLIFDLNLKKKYFLHFLVLIISGILVYLSSERTSLFCFIGISLFSILYFQKKNILTLLVLFLFFFSAIVFTYPNPLKRIYYHTIDQVYENNKFNFFSFRHQLHYLTAYNIFKQNKLFGAGTKSFRFLCDKEEYSVREFISEKKIIYAPFDGFFFQSKNDAGNIAYFVSDDLYKNLNLDAYYDINKKISTLDQKFPSSDFAPNKNEILIYRFPDKFLSDFFGNKNGENLKKDQNLLLIYEFRNGCNTHPHNFYIQAFSEIGIIGAVFLICFYIFCLINLLRCIRDRLRSKLNNELILYANFFIILFPLLPSGNFFNNYLSLLIYLPLAFINLWTLKSRS
jgi:O-antigen ligase